MAAPINPMGLWSDAEILALDRLVGHGINPGAEHLSLFPGRTLHAIQRKASKRRVELRVAVPVRERRDLTPLLTVNDLEVHTAVSASCQSLQRRTIDLFRRKASTERISVYQAMVRLNFAPEYAAEYERRAAR